MKMTYDLIISLGGNCSAAHNLRFRGLRPCSLPFDWCYLVDDTPIRFWIDEVGHGFPGLLKRENLVEILPNDKEYSAFHSDVRQYIDTKSGYRFVNHFHRSVDVPGEYEAVYAAIRRRADRLVSAFERGGSFLLLLATPVDVSTDLLKRFVSTLAERFGSSHFDLRYLHFGQGHDAETDMGGGGGGSSFRMSGVNRTITISPRRTGSGISLMTSVCRGGAREARSLLSSPLTYGRR